MESVCIQIARSTFYFFYNIVLGALYSIHQGSSLQAKKVQYRFYMSTILMWMKNK